MYIPPLALSKFGSGFYSGPPPPLKRKGEAPVRKIEGILQYNHVTKFRTTEFLSQKFTITAGHKTEEFVL